ncbi:MAG: hypothetical protein CMN02_10920 [Roseibacillus sp.]|nr:hypothetical protein [Roseibacillus sp.]
MKTNLSFAACVLLFTVNAVGAGVSADSEPLLQGSALDCRHERREELFLAPVNPGLSLDPIRSEIAYPHVNATLGGDLCRLQNRHKPSRKVQRSPHYLEVELARVDQNLIRARRAGLSPWLLLLLPLLLWSRSFRRREDG